MCPSGVTTSYDHQATSHDTSDILTDTQTVSIKWWQLLGHSGPAFPLLFIFVSIQFLWVYNRFFVLFSQAKSKLLLTLFHWHHSVIEVLTVARS